MISLGSGAGESGDVVDNPLDYLDLFSEAGSRWDGGMNGFLKFGLGLEKFVGGVVGNRYEQNVVSMCETNFSNEWVW